MSPPTNGTGDAASAANGKQQAQFLLRQTPLTCSGHTRPVVFLSFSDFNPHDEANYYCISACKDGKPMLRQGDTGDWIGTFEGHKGAVWGCDLNRDATRAATGAADFSAKLWDAASGAELASLKHDHIVKSVKFAPDSSGRLATAANDRKLRIFDVAEADKVKDPVVTFLGHEKGIKQVVFASSGAELISLSDDRSVRFWDSRSGQETKRIDLNENPGGLELTADESVLTVAQGNKVTFFDAKNREQIKEISFECPIYTASLLKEKNIFVAGGEDFKLYKYDFETGKEIESFKGHFGPVHCVRFSPDGELYASGSEDGTLRLWQTEVGKNYGLWKCVDTVNATETNAKGEAATAS